MNRCLNRLLPLLLLAIFFSPVHGQAETNRFIPVDELKPGMRGKAVSVFKGTETDSFTVELQGIVDGPVAGNRYMLLRIADESLRLGSGFSGSPVYFKGRLAGAISHMEKNLVGQYVYAVPIARMLEDATRSGRTLPHSPPKSGTMLEPGSMIMVPLVRGDFWLGASGTVTHVENGLLLAFGHENMFSGNNLELPVHRATVHAVIPKSDISHKETSPLEEVGSVIWDGKSALVAHLGSKAAMVPLDITFKDDAGTARRYNLEMAAHSKIAPQLITRSVRSIVAARTPNRPGGTDLDLTLTAAIKGLEQPVTINQRLHAESLKTDSPASTTPLETLLKALLLPFSDTGALTGASITLTEIADARTGRIVETSFVRTRARAGETVPLRVRLSGPYGKSRNISIPVTIPEGYEDGAFTVSVHSGTSVRPALTPPESPLDIPRWLSGIARSDDLVVLSPATMSDRIYPDAGLTRTMARSPWNVEGSGEASITVIKH